MGQVHHYELGNGLVLVAEQISGVQSLAMTFLVPAGMAREPQDQMGVSALLSEMVSRGAGKYDARAHSDALDQFGVLRGTTVETTHLCLNATMLGCNRLTAMPLLVDMIRSPWLAQNALEPARDLAVQAIDALEDEPQHKVFLKLRERHFPQPFGRSPLGRRDHLEAMTLAQVREFHAQIVPKGSIIGFAGNFQWDDLKGQVQQLLGDWRGDSAEPALRDAAPRGYLHDAAESAQVHIGLAYDALPEPHPQSILQRAASAVLSGGMSGRLFTEVRERHGLCYAVYASYAGNKYLGAMLSYAGTTAPRAQQTFDVLTHELRRLSEGVAADEFQRAMIGMKSALVMQGESTSARAHAIAADQYIYGRPRTLDERIAQLDAVTLEDLNAFIRERPPGPMTVVTIGPTPLVMEPTAAHPV